MEQEKDLDVAFAEPAGLDLTGGDVLWGVTGITQQAEHELVGLDCTGPVPSGPADVL